MVSLAQQWDQLGQMVMRMQHNLEQQIQARCAPHHHHITHVAIFEKLGIMCS